MDVTHIFPDFKVQKQECHAFKAQQEHILYEGCFMRYHTGHTKRVEGGVLYAEMRRHFFGSSASTPSPMSQGARPHITSSLQPQFRHFAFSFGFGLDFCIIL
ncbi:hypothetical protein H4582DRAFT_2060217 [Lactarius indigo]|nr:hypothetical protein H4582DRAFT_2060217 [Lactarius indigo]